MCSQNNSLCGRNYRDKTIKELASLADDIATTQHAARVTERRCHRIDQHLAEDKKNDGGTVD